MRWALILFDSPEKCHIVRVLYFDRMRDLAYVCGHPAQRMSNLFHGMVRATGVLQYIHIEQV